MSECQQPTAFRSPCLIIQMFCIASKRKEETLPPDPTPWSRIRLAESLHAGSAAMRRFIYKTLERFHIGDEAFHLLLATIIGCLAGLGSVAFLLLIRFFEKLFFGGIFPAMGSHPYLVFLLPLLGGLLIGPLLQRFPTEAKGDGVPSAMEAIALHGGILRPRTVGLRTLTAAVTIGSGGSVGREAPIAQIGAAIGSAVGQFLKVSASRMRIFVACGAAGGIAAVFNAPIGGVFFSLEVLLGDFSAATFAPIVIASVVSTAVARLLAGERPDLPGAPVRPLGVSRSRHQRRPRRILRACGHLFHARARVRGKTVLLLADPPLGKGRRGGRDDRVDRHPFPPGPRDGRDDPRCGLRGRVPVVPAPPDRLPEDRGDLLFPRVRGIGGRPGAGGLHRRDSRGLRGNRRERLVPGACRDSSAGMPSSAWPRSSPRSSGDPSRPY